MARLRVVGLTAHGHHRLQVESRSHPGLFHDVLVSKDGTRVSCDCAACVHHADAKEGRLTLRRADVLAHRVPRVCWHIAHCAQLAPLLVSGHAQILPNRAEAGRYAVAAWDVVKQLRS